MARHLVYKQKVTLHLSKKDEAYAFQERVSRLLQNDLKNSLEKILDKIFPSDKIIRIDSLQLDLGNINALNFETEFKAQFITELTKSLSEKKEKLSTTQGGETELSKAQSLKNALIFFLEKGYLPWYSSVAKKAGWEDEILNTLSASEYQYLSNWMKSNYQDNPVIIERLISQFSDKFIGELLLKTIPAFDEPWTSVSGDYLFILSSIGKNTLSAADQTETSDAEDLNEVSNNFLADSPAVRAKIWQCVFDILLDVKYEDPAFEVLDLLLAHYDIQSKHIQAVNEKEINKGLKTKTVKQAFKKLTAFFKADNAKNKAGSKSLHDKNDANNAGADNSSPKDTNVDKDSNTTNEIAVQNKTSENNTGNDKSQSDTPGFDQNIKAATDKEDESREITGDVHPEKRKKDESKGEDNDIAERNNVSDHDNASALNKGRKSTGENDENISAERKSSLDDGTDDTTIKGIGTSSASGNSDESLNRLASVKKPLKNGIPTPKRNSISEGEVISVINCGIIMLHPFLKPYFEGLDIFKDGKFINEDARGRAVLLLNYLATGETGAAEFDLTLQKILCGHPMEDTLPAAIKLSRKEKTESDNLLSTVINYCEPLKNTSIEGFRSTFLQRNGRLESKESGWLLTVEQKTVDILLGKLPWGFSTIRLSWMQNMLSVDWC